MTKDPAVIIFAERWFRLLVRAYPATFREEMGDAMVEAFRDRARDAHHQSGAVSVLRLCASATVDTIRNGPGEHMRPANMWPRSGQWRPVARSSNVRTWHGFAASTGGAQALSRPFVALWQDTLQAYRGAFRARTTATASILTMATGIAAVTTLGIVGYATVIQPLPWPESDRLVWPVEFRAGREGRLPLSVSNGTYLEWLNHHDTIESVGGWRSQRMTFAANSVAERMQVTWVTPSLFDVLRAQPANGRAFRQEEAGNAEGGPLIISHAVWSSKFGKRQDVLGTSVTVDDRPYTIIGVMPERWHFPDATTEAWIPWRIPTVLAGPPGSQNTRMVIFAALARLRPGVSLSQAAQEATARALAAPDAGMSTVALFGAAGPVAVDVRSLEDVVRTQSRPLLLLLALGSLAMFGCAAANVLNLQMAASLARDREIVLRLTLGAAPARLKWQLFLESCLVSGVGGIVGLGLSAAALAALWSLVPSAVTQSAQATLTGIGVLMAALATAICAIGVGLPLVFRIRGVTSKLTAGTLTTQYVRVTSPRRAMANVLIVAQVAASCALIILAGAVTESVLKMVQKDRGYDPAGVFAAQLPFPRPYPTARREQLIEAMLGELRSSPLVAHAGVSNALPLVSSGGFTGFSMPALDGSGTMVPVEAAHRIVSPGYFPALSIRLLRGRLLDDTDTAIGRPVVVVNDTFAREYLGSDPIGSIVPVRFGGTDAARWEVVGVVNDTEQSASAGYQPEVYASYQQVPIDSQRVRDRVLVVKGVAPDASLSNALTAMLARADSNLAFDRVVPLVTLLAEEQRQARLALATTGAFAVLAWIVASVGIFAMFSRDVASRAKEFGVRMAVGARPAALQGTVYRHALVVGGAGVVLGTWAAWAATRWSSFVTLAHDTPVILLGALLSIASCVLAVVIPAFRASATDPTQLLKSDT